MRCRRFRGRRTGPWAFPLQSCRDGCLSRVSERPLLPLQSPERTAAEVGAPASGMAASAMRAQARQVLTAGRMPQTGVGEASGAKAASTRAAPGTRGTEQADAVAQAAAGKSGGAASPSAGVPVGAPQTPGPADDVYVVAVRALCEFTAKAGDLDHRFTPSPSAQEGMAGHALVASRRGPDYRSEIALSGRFETLHVRGRADGYDPRLEQLEEIKTHRGDLSRQPANHRALHWAQLRVYGWLYCETHGLAQLRLALVYLDIGSQRETHFSEVWQADALKDFFETQCRRFIARAEAEIAHRAERDAALEGLRFPHAEFRKGQRPLAEAVYRAATAGRCLVAQAPTGIGKTVGTLFPMLKACPREKLDRVFFLTAKTSGRRVALDALAALETNAPLPLRTIELVAREKACEYPGRACHGEDCVLARGFYDRLPAAREQALTQRRLDQATVREVARAHAICPYYLSQDLVRWSDVVIGDYNYYFDLGGLLHGLTLMHQWRVGVLVDEAHNLLERARRMYTAALGRAGLKRVRRGAHSLLKKPLARLDRIWGALERESESDYAVRTELPESFLSALQQASTAITDLLAEQPGVLDGETQDFYFEALHFLRLAEHFDTHSLCDLGREGAPARGARGALTRLTLRNVLPAPFLKTRFAAARVTVLFSATLAPWRFYGDMLGVPADAVWVDVPSPFHAGQLEVRRATHISTRYAQRERSVAPIVALMGAQYRALPGNYLAFFSSYDYMRCVAQRFASDFPEVPSWTQAPRMGEAEQAEFLARFVAGGRGIGFAVLGGAFGEGIDLPGERLIGAFVATLGLPQMNPVNEEMRRRIDAQFGAGYDYTYLYPGMQKVVQAAGRVIRTHTDRGVIHLIDDRFARREVARLLPDWWQIASR